MGVLFHALKAVPHARDITAVMHYPLATSPEQKMISVVFQTWLLPGTPCLPELQGY